MDLLREKRRARDEHRLYCASEPNTEGINRAAEANAEVAKDALKWFTTEYERSQPQRDAAAALNEKVANANIASMESNTALANEYADYNRSTFRPLERGIVADAQNFNTEEKREQLAGRAIADVTQQSAMADQMQTRNMARLGINPADGAWAAGATQRSIAQAAAAAGAGTKSQMDAIAMGHAMKMDAASLGRGLPGNQATSANIALNAGSGATNAAGLSLAQQQAAAGLMGQGFNTAIQGNQSAGNLYGTAGQLQNQAGAANNSIWSGLGSAAGMIGAAYLGVPPIK